MMDHFRSTIIPPRTYPDHSNSGTRVLVPSNNGKAPGAEGSPHKQRTQKDQDEADADARKEAVKDLISAWNDRLQLITVLATFFASTEAGMLQVTTSGDGNLSDYNQLQQATNACFVGALIIHTNAAIFSFLASFVLIRFKVKEAHREERTAEGKVVTESPVDLNAAEKSSSHHALDLSSSTPLPNPVFSANPHLDRVGPGRRDSPPEGLLRRCHSLCVYLCAGGFILALMGIICFAWSTYPLSVSIFSTACMAFCGIAGVLALTPF